MTLCADVGADGAVWFGGALLARGAMSVVLALACASCAHSTIARQETPLVEDESVLSRPAPGPDITIRYGSDDAQIADVRYGKGKPEARPLVILIHGGFWRPAYDRAHAGPMSVALAHEGWTVGTIEYRRVPGKPDLTLEDVSRAVDALPALVTRHNGKAILIGHSAGGHLVLWAGATTRSASLAGVVALAPAADLQLAQQRNSGNGAVTAFLGADAASRRDLDPKLLPAPKVPVTIIHGDLDDTVLPGISKSYVATHASTRLVTLEKAGHYGIIDPLSAVWPTVLEELRRLSR